MVGFAAWPALRGQMNWEVMKLVCSLVCFIHTVFVQFLFLTEFGHWNSYHFLWPVLHEVSSFFTLRLKNILVKLFLLREWITKLMELLFLYFSINECDDLISTIFCHAGLAFSEATPTTRENLLCVWLSQDCSFSPGCTAFCFFLIWQLVMGLFDCHFFIRQDHSGSPHDLCDSIKSNQELQSVDVDPLQLLETWSVF